LYTFLFFLWYLVPPCSTLFPYTTLFRSSGPPVRRCGPPLPRDRRRCVPAPSRRDLPSSYLTDRQPGRLRTRSRDQRCQTYVQWLDRKSTRLNSSHVKISYAVFCLKKKKN